MASNPPVYSRRTYSAVELTPGQFWLRRVALVLCTVTFPLLWIGGLVTTTKSGMAVPDWPGTYGYNLLLYPWTSWLFGPWDLFIEHGHRLLATLAGLLTMVLMVLLFRVDRRPWMRWVGVAAMVGVVAQGVLGGLRVVLDERLLAMLHGSTGPLFFALTVAIVVWTSRLWHSSGVTNESERSASVLSRLVPLSLTTCLLVYAQMLLGATLRHMPATASPHAFTTTVKAHLFIAFVVTVSCFAICMMTLRPAMPRVIRWVGCLVAGIVAAQVGLGLVTWLAKYGVPLWAMPIVGASSTATLADGWWQTHVVTAHQATGSLLLAVTLSSTLLAWRLAPASDVAVNSIASNTISKGAATT